MDDRLLVPASRALLDGWIGPVLYLDAGRNWTRGVLVGVGPAHAEVYALEGVDAGGTALVTISGGLALYTGWAECRDRLRRSLSKKDPRHRWDDDSATAWRVYRGVGEAIYFAYYSDRDAWPGVQVLPALAALDPRDNTRLPDGSRFVDAAALAIVARVQRG